MKIFVAHCRNGWYWGVIKKKGGKPEYPQNKFFFSQSLAIIEAKKFYPGHKVCLE